MGLFKSQAPSRLGIKSPVRPISQGGVVLQPFRPVAISERRGGNGRSSSAAPVEVRQAAASKVVSSKRGKKVAVPLALPARVPPASPVLRETANSVKDEGSMSPENMSSNHTSPLSKSIGVKADSISISRLRRRSHVGGEQRNVDERFGKKITPLGKPIALEIDDDTVPMEVCKGAEAMDLSNSDDDDDKVEDADEDKNELKWLCEVCNAEHTVTSKTALAPFTKAHGFKICATPKDGDCFYNSVRSAVASGDVTVTVSEMREWVSHAISPEHLHFYQVQAQAHPQETWLDFVRQSAGPAGIPQPQTQPTVGRRSARLVALAGGTPSADVENAVGGGGAKVRTCAQLREYVQREGSEWGQSECLWADDMAFKVVAETLGLCILFVDMERAANACPWRLLAKCSNKAPQDVHYIVLKRQGPVGHFVYISTVDGRAYFTYEELPNAIKTLWRDHLVAEVG